MLCLVVASLPVHVEVSPPVDHPTEDRLCDRWSECGRIVSRLQDSDSAYADLLVRLEENLSELEKDEVRVKMKRKISKALKVGGIPRQIRQNFTMVFVNLSINNIEVVKARRGKSIVLYLRCLSVGSLLRLREIVLSGLLLRLISDTIKLFIKSGRRVQLIIHSEDFSTCLSSLINAGGIRSLCLAEYCLIFLTIN